MNYIPKYDLESRIQHSKFQPATNFKSGVRVEGIESPESTDFKQVLNDLMGNLNEVANAPDDLLKDVMSGSKNVDVHDVMTAISKAEISINIATQMTGKVINAYDRVMQISV